MIKWNVYVDHVIFVSKEENISSVVKRNRILDKII